MKKNISNFSEPVKKKGNFLDYTSNLPEQNEKLIPKPVAAPVSNQSYQVLPEKKESAKSEEKLKEEYKPTEPKLVVPPIQEPKVTYQAPKSTPAVV